MPVDQLESLCRESLPVALLIAAIPACIKLISSIYLASLAAASADNACTTGLSSTGVEASNRASYINWDT